MIEFRWKMLQRDESIPDYAVIMPAPMKAPIEDWGRSFYMVLQERHIAPKDISNSLVGYTWTDWQDIGVNKEC